MSICHYSENNNKLKYHFKMLDKGIFYSCCLLFFFIPIGMSPAVISGILMLALWLLSGKAFRQKFWYPWTLPVLLLATLPWIGLLYTNNTVNGMFFAKKSYYWLYAFAIASISFQRYSASIMMRAYIFGTTLSSSVSLLQYFGFIPMKKGMPIAFFYWHQTYALVLALGLILTSFYILNSRDLRDKILYALIFLLIFSALVIVPGRAGHLVSLVSAPFIGYKLLKIRNFLKILALCILTAGLLFISPVVRERISQGLEDIKEYRAGNINTAIGWRLHLMNVSLEIIKENHLFGIGTGSFKDELRKYKTDRDLPDSSQPHNNFLYMAVSFGIIGAVPLVWLFVLLFRNGWKNFNRIEGFSIFMYAIVIFIGGMFDTQIVMPATGVMLALFTGLQTALYGGHN